MDRILPDKPYFESGGGVTLSGGEPTLYPKFLDRFIDLCVRSGIHTGIETAGRFSLEKCLPILEKIDLIYFDLKILDPVRHEQAVGKGLEIILSNAEYLTKNKFPVEFRMPLVPGYTDTKENIDAAVEFLKSIGHPKLHLLEYHNMGEVKIDIIQGKQPKLGLSRCTDESLAAIARRFEKAGIEIANRSSLS
jgi:pyruvate formate lyase activating enzyme